MTAPNSTHSADWVFLPATWSRIGTTLARIREVGLVGLIRADNRLPMRPRSACASAMATSGLRRPIAVHRRGHAANRSMLSRRKRQYVVAGVQISVCLSGK
jgi:hypothetical protein